MDSYDELQLHIKNNFESFKESAINELILYYGEEYSDQIISRINNAGFIFYVNPNLKLKSKKNRIYLKKYYKLIRKEIIENSRDKIIYNSTNKYYPMTKRIIDKNYTGFSYFYNKSTRNVDTVIHISLFLASDEDVIHEMIHACMGTPLLLISDKNDIDLKYKNGINVLRHEGEDFLEECLTQTDAIEVERRLMSKGISFINRYYPYDHFISFYNNFIPFINSFYNTFKPEIIESRLTLNLRKLMDIIGKENYYRYIELIKTFYDDYYNCDKSTYKYFLDKEVDKMRKESCRILKKN